ncbi:sensor histidine kinase [Burkholderia sp. 22PA0106]|uniref:sensor histidine kinase n=1 Tax=Burkholderia sp. 22PA0106 TaxID=3237371 RepID=UPI0039C45738
MQTRWPVRDESASGGDGRTRAADGLRSQYRCSSSRIHCPASTGTRDVGRAVPATAVGLPGPNTIGIQNPHMKGTFLPSRRRVPGPPAAIVPEIRRPHPVCRWGALVAVMGLLDPIPIDARASIGPISAALLAGVLVELLRAWRSTSRRATPLPGQAHYDAGLVAKWIDCLPEATLVAADDGTILLANEQVFVFSAHSEVGPKGRRSPVGRKITDVLFEITASHRAIEFAAKALALTAPLEAAHMSSARAALSQGIEVINARGGRSLLIKCAVIWPRPGQAGSLIFHVADVSSIRIAERQRDTVLRFLSHDMRAPQAAILTLVAQMREDPPRYTTQRFTDLVAQYANSALNLADDFLFLARAESVPPKLVHVDPALVLGDAVDDLWPQASAKSTTVDLLAEPGVTTMADVQLLRRAFGNLIGNAIKFSPHCALVKIRLAAKSTHVNISFVDGGIGMSASSRKNLFQEFNQFDAHLSATGHGLGLAFVKSVVDSLGGRLFVRSSPGKGTTFTMRLPRSAYALTPTADSP